MRGVVVTAYPLAHFFRQDGAEVTRLKCFFVHGVEDFGSRCACEAGVMNMALLTTTDCGYKHLRTPR